MPSHYSGLLGNTSSVNPGTGVGSGYNDVKISDLIDAVLEEADMQNTDFASRKTTLRFINSEFRELYDLLVAAYQDYFISTEAMTLEADVNNYALPANFFKLRNVLYAASDGSLARIRSISSKQFDSYTGGTAVPVSSFSYGGGETNIRYLIQGGYISFYPNPSGGENIYLVYIPQPRKFLSENDVVHIRIPVGWEDFVIHGAVVRWLLKEESDPTGHLMLKEASKKHIMEMAEERDEGDSAVVSDVYSNLTEWDLM